MKWDKQHENALETCIDCIEKGIPLSLWIACGIPDEDRIEVIRIANERLSHREPSLFC